MTTWLPWSSPYTFSMFWWRTFLNPTAYAHFRKADHRDEIANDLAVDVDQK